MNFTSTPLHLVNLKKLTNGAEDGFVKAVVSKLDPADAKDQSAMQELNKVWKNRSNLVYGLCSDFAKNINKAAEYYAIELQSSCSLAERLIGLLQIYPQTNFISKKERLILSTLATKPALIASNSNRSIKNIGEALLGETICKAKEKGVSEVGFYATKSNYTFYKNSFNKAGLNDYEFGNPSGENLYYFVINEKSFDKYIDYCQNKYQTNFSASI